MDRGPSASDLDSVGHIPQSEEIIDHDPMRRMMESFNERLEQAYQLGLLHGINASSMSRAERNVMEFGDYAWTLEDDPDYEP
jgi:hypothetical protein